MMNFQTLEIEQHGGRAHVWMNRPDLHNAFNETLIQELTQAFEHLGQAEDVRVIILSGRGKSFSAGADLDWMKRASEYSFEQNKADADRLATMLKTIYRCPKPTIARVNGAAFGGGTGLTAVCDIAIASDKAVFSLSEVRLGLIPATIGPYVCDAIGWRQARRYFLSAERISAATALQIGMVHEVATAETLDTRIDALASELEKGGPAAQSAAKSLLEALRKGHPFDEALIDDSAQRIASIRVTPEAKEGLDAFFDKRPAAWIPHSAD